MSAGGTVRNIPAFTASCLIGGLGIAVLDRAKLINLAVGAYIGGTPEGKAGFGGGGFGFATPTYSRHSFEPLFAGGDLLWTPPEPEPLDIAVSNIAFPL